VVSDRRELLIVAGELSGDLLASALVSEIKARCPEWRFVGAGGPHLKAAGVQLLYESCSWSAIGFAQSVRLIPRLSFALSGIKRYIARHRPHRVILVDFGTFNVRVARFAKKQGVPVCYYIPPGCWRRGWANPELARITDLVMTPFPWSAEELRRVGANAHWIGHPLLDLVRPRRSREEVLSLVGIQGEPLVVGLLPGSRRAELSAMVPLVARAASLIQSHCSPSAFVLAAAPNADLAYVEKLLCSAGWKKTDASSDSAVLKFTVGDAPAGVVVGAAYDVMAASDILLCCSGTVTLEAAILGKPMIIMYRSAGIAMAAEYAIGRGKLPRFIGLPNLIADAEICPEFVQERATPANLAAEVLSVLRNRDRLVDMFRGLREVRSTLGEPGAASRAAELICDPKLGAGDLQ
jgi:lipid-A-disaccharide synthase